MVLNFVSDYLSYLEIERGLSQNTISAYKNDLFLFFEYFNKINTIEEVKRSHLSEYIKYLGQTHCIPATITRKIASIKGFFRYMCSTCEIKSNPSLSIATPKVSKKLPKVINIDEIEKIFKELKISYEYVDFDI